MVRVDIREAQRNLAALVDTVLRGDEVLITKGTLPAARLVSAVEEPARPRFGSARGLITIADDFDAPLSDFDEYTG